MAARPTGEQNAATRDDPPQTTKAGGAPQGSREQNAATRDDPPQGVAGRDTIPVQPEWLEVVDDDRPRGASAAPPDPAHHAPAGNQDSTTTPRAPGRPRRLGPPPLPHVESERPGARASRPPGSKKSGRPKSDGA